MLRTYLHDFCMYTLIVFILFLCFRCDDAGLRGCWKNRKKSKNAIFIHIVYRKSVEFKAFDAMNWKRIRYKIDASIVEYISFYISFFHQSLNWQQQPNMFFFSFCFPCWTATIKAINVQNRKERKHYILHYNFMFGDILLSSADQCYILFSSFTLIYSSIQCWVRS